MTKTDGIILIKNNVRAEIMSEITDHKSQKQDGIKIKPVFIHPL